MTDVYRIEIDINGIDSGSEQLASKTGETLPKPTKKPSDKKKKVSAFSKIEDVIGKEEFASLKKTLGTATAVGYIALDLHQQQQSFQGDSNRVTRINEGKRIAGVLGTTAVLVASGNYTGAALFVGYTALSLAKENRELINTAAVDAYSSAYFVERLVNDKTKRSR